MADEVDRGQESGDIARDGQHGEAVRTSDSLSLDRRRVAEWRDVRDAGEQAVEGAIRKPRAATSDPAHKLPVAKIIVPV
jgi:hypothetical protein